MHSALFYAILLTVPCLALSITVNVTRIPLPPGVEGPESLAFDKAGVGPYTGVSDGRILKFANNNFVDFAVATPNRLKICYGLAIPLPICGRVLGLEFYNKTGDLYFVNAYSGLCMVNKTGGKPNILATSAEGVRFRFADGLDIDQDRGTVYFTDASSVFSLSEIELAIATRDRTGRLLSYDIRTQELKVLLRQLGGPGGVAVSRNGSFVLISEAVNNRILRLWLTGPKANTSEVFANLTAMPDNIKRNSRGDFWVATTRNKMPPPGRIAIGLRFDENGVLKQNVTFNVGTPSPMLSEVQERNNSLFLGFLNERFMGRVTP